MTSSITNVLDDLNDQAAESEKVSVKSLIDATKQKGCGASLISMSLICILPTGAIPFVPALCAVLIILVSGQTLIGRDRLWIPKAIGDKKIEASRVENSIKKFKPWAKKLDTIFKPRLAVLVSKPSIKIMTACTIALSIGIIFLGFVPFIALVPGLAILLFGIALTFEDGVAMLAGYVAFALGTLTFLYGFGFI